MDECGFYDAVFAVAVLCLAHLMDGLVPLIGDFRGDHVDQHTDDKADEHLDAENAENERRRGVPCDEDGQHFVRGGEKYRKERAPRNDAAGIEIGHCRGKTALRYDAECRTEYGPPTPRPMHDGHGLLLGPVFDKFNGEICRKQKRQQLQAVNDGLTQNFPKQMNFLQ